MSDPLPPAVYALPPAPNVWPPPPGGLRPPVYGPPPFAALRSLATSVCVLLGVYAAAALAALAAAASLPLPQLEVADVIVILVQTTLLVATVLCFLAWTYRLTANLRAFGVPRLRHTPGWAVGGFFVPILGLYHPYRAFREIWQGSGPQARTAPDWRKLPVSPLLGVWWCSWLLTNVLGDQSLHSSGPQIMDHRSADLLDGPPGHRPAGSRRPAAGGVGAPPVSQARHPSTGALEGPIRKWRGLGKEVTAGGAVIRRLRSSSCPTLNPSPSRSRRPRASDGLPPGGALRSSRQPTGQGDHPGAWSEPVGPDREAARLSEELDPSAGCRGPVHAAEWEH